MDTSREQLTSRLTEHYRGQGWATRAGEDGVVLADGPGGVTWIGAAVVGHDLASGELENRLVDLADRRMSHGGELCPLELLPAADCVDELEGLLERLGLADRRHVAVYSLAA